jgi:N-methylhydantoinase A/oxoprolinase/acetone carboxylase beta subunit
MPRYVVACDAGGTMTDVIIVDEEGRSVIGKAPTSPQDESIGYMESFWEALEFMGISQEEGRDFGKQIETAIYTGTSMLNTVINMSGYKTGLLVNKGFEDILAQGRARKPSSVRSGARSPTCSTASTGSRWYRVVRRAGSPSGSTCSGR